MLKLLPIIIALSLASSLKRPEVARDFPRMLQVASYNVWTWSISSPKGMILARTLGVSEKLRDGTGVKYSI